MSEQHKIRNVSVELENRIRLYENVFSRGEVEAMVQEASAASSRDRQMDEQGLILPKKLINPCLESREVQDLNKEIKWNAKTGINVLAGKSELEKALDRRKWQQKEVERREETERAKTDFQRMLAERAKKMEQTSSPPASSAAPSSTSEPEFMRVRLKHLDDKGAAVRSN